MDFVDVTRLDRVVYLDRECCHCRQLDTAMGASHPGIRKVYVPPEDAHVKTEFPHCFENNAYVGRAAWINVFCASCGL